MEKRIKSAISMFVALFLMLSIIPLSTIHAKADGIDDFIGRCYKVTLGRDADSDGYAYWRDILVNRKQDGSVVAHGFLFSPEYIDKNTTPEQYVKDLYMLFMGREPEQSGYDYWCEKMANGETREQIFAGFANSKEYFDLCNGYGITAGYYSADYDIQQINGVNLFVERMYQTSLDRLGDQGGQNDWVQALLEGRITGIECARCFVQSPEFINKGLSNDYYLKSLYRAFMGREFDKGGLDYWLENMKYGYTRDEVFAGFANSPEFAGICANYGITKGNYTATDKGTFEIYQAMIALKETYPEGMSWTNSNHYKNGSGCVGFALIVSDAVFGDRPINYLDNVTFNDICVGDILRINNDTHSVIVLRKSENEIEIAEGNYGGTIHWGRIIDKDRLGKIDYIWTRYDLEERENFKNIDQRNNIPHEHVFDKKEIDSKFIKSAATCQETATYYFSCVCGEFDENKTFTYGKPTNHKFDNKVKDNVKYLKSAATCTEPATYYMSCIWCGEPDKEHTFTSGNALGHRWDAGTVTSMATMDEDGIMTYHCLRCDETKTEIIPKVNLSNLKAGDIVGFGKYEQDGDLQNGKETIEWKILAIDDNSAFLISRYCLDSQPFNNTSEIVEWKDSSLRKWLNNEFLNNAFSTKQQEMIIPIDTYDDKEEICVGTEKISCLGLDEAKNYFSVSWDEQWGDGRSYNIICSPTTYAINQGVLYSESDSQYGSKYKNNAYWWLKTESYTGHYKVYGNGFINPHFDYGDSCESIGVRPCVRIKIE